MGNRNYAIKNDRYDYGDIMCTSPGGLDTAARMTIRRTSIIFIFQVSVMVLDTSQLHHNKKLIAKNYLVEWGIITNF